MQANKNISQLVAEQKSLPRGIEPRSPALIRVSDKRKSSPLDQGRWRLAELLLGHLVLADGDARFLPLSAMARIYITTTPSLPYSIIYSFLLCC